MQSRTILITGGAGFIGSYLVKFLVNKYPHYNLHIIDNLNYAGDIDNLKEVIDDVTFHKQDITDTRIISKLFELYSFDGVFHLAAQTHVDNSIKNPDIFIDTNIMGTVNMINLCLEHSCRLLSVSTAASKACADLLTLSFHRTYNLNCNITHCSNNFGPHQHDEKFIPTIVKSLVTKRPIPIYGTGENVRDWLSVKEHVDALDVVFHNGKSGEEYNIGTHNEISNFNLVTKICQIYDTIKNNETDSRNLVTFVEDRVGHDDRYAVNSDKLKNKLRWKPKTDFITELTETIKFYINKYESNRSI